MLLGNDSSLIIVLVVVVMFLTSSLRFPIQLFAVHFPRDVFERSRRAAVITFERTSGSGEAAALGFQASDAEVPARACGAAGQRSVRTASALQCQGFPQRSVISKQNILQ